MFFVISRRLLLARFCPDILHADFRYYCSKNYLGLILSPAATRIGKSVSDAIKLLHQVLPKKNIETTVIASRLNDDSGQVSSSSRIWQHYVYFD